MSGFLSRHCETLRKTKAKPVELLRFLCFNSQSMSQFYAEVSHVFEKYSIMKLAQVFNLDETGYSTGRENEGRNFVNVISVVPGAQTDSPKLSFSYTDRVKVMGCVTANSKYHCPCIVLKGQRESRPHLDGMLTKILDILGDNWMVIYRKELGGMDSN